MATVDLDQYLTSVLKANKGNQSEIKLKAGNENFDLFTLYLENHNYGVHQYKMDVSTILFVISGQITIKSGQKIIELKVGNVLLLTENYQYEVMRQTRDAVLVKLKFQPGFRYKKFFRDLACKSEAEQKVIEGISDSLENEHVLWLKNNAMTRPTQVMHHIIDGYLGNELFIRALIGAELTIMLIVSIRNQKLVTPVSLDKTKFEKAALDEYIDNHFVDITLAKTARYFGFNPNYFSNMVKQKTGKSFVDHVYERRMREAKDLLAQPDISLKEIISRVGYSSKSFFYKKFNEYYHMTPAVMRDELFAQAKINLK